MIPRCIKPRALKGRKKILKKEKSQYLLSTIPTINHRTSFAEGNEVDSLQYLHAPPGKKGRAHSSLSRS